MKLRDKMAGALYGMALGDAMGMPSELWGRKRVQNYFGEITEFLDGPPENEVAFNYKKGQITDDTGQALVILDSLVENNYEPNAQIIAKNLLKWAEKENAFENNILGPTSKLALGNFRDGKEDPKVTNKALTNGSAMRIAPIGCFFNPSQKEEIVNYVYEVSKVTHTSDVTIAGAAMIAVAVSSAIEAENFETILNDIYSIEKLGYEKGAETFSPKLSARIKIGIEIAKKCLGNDREFLDEIYDVVGAGVGIIESVPAAIAIAYYSQDPNKASLLCANLAGDTDTIGAMAVAICGAFVGASKIKSSYRETLEKQNDINFENYIHILVKGREMHS